jgi:perosamine synthetase
LSPLVEQITAAVSAVAGSDAPLHAPEIGGNEWAYVKECLDTEWVSTVGAYVDRFESELAAYTGAKYVVATINGTAALHAAMVLAGVEAGDEVIVPALTFVATANAVAYCGATPHFADADERTLGLDPAKLDAHLSEVAKITATGCINKNTGRKIAAVVCVHTFGHAADLDELAKLCDRYGLTLIEDAAESLGTYYKGRHTGNHGRLSTLSFNGNKIVTSGGGGAIMTNDEALGKRARHLTTIAKMPHRWEYAHDEIGFNYRLPNVNAAIGVAQMEQLPDFRARKRALAERYRAAFEAIDGVRFFTEPENSNSNYWLNVLLLNDAAMALRDSVLAALNEAELMSRPAWTPMHKLAMFADCPRADLSVAESLFTQLINIPSSPRLMND